MNCGDNPTVSEMLPKTADVVPSGKIALITGITGQVRTRRFFLSTKAKVFFFVYIFNLPGFEKDFFSHCCDVHFFMFCRMGHILQSSCCQKAIKYMGSSEDLRASTPAESNISTRILRPTRKDHFSNSTTVT